MDNIETKYINLLNIIQQTELVATKIHGVLDKEEIFRIIEYEFGKSKQYQMLILLLSNYEKAFNIKSVTVPFRKLTLIEKILNMKISDIRMDYENISVLHKVIEEGETYFFKTIELIKQILPGSMAYIVAKITGHEKKITAVAPIKIGNKIIGVFAVDTPDSPELIKYFCLSIKNLAQHISVALEFAEEIERVKITKNDLLRSETKYRTLYDSTNDAIMLLNEKGFFDCNNATLKLFGCATKDEFCSNHPADLSPPFQACLSDSMALANQQIAIAIEKGTNKFDWLHKKAYSEEIFPAEVLLSRMELDGNIVLQATIRDITLRKKAEEELQILNTELEFDIEKRIETENSLQKAEEKYHKLLDNASDAIIISNLEGKIIEINSKVIELTGYSKDELLNQHFTIFIPADELQNVETSKKQLTDYGFYKISEGNVLCKDAKKIPIDITGNIIEFDNQKVVQTIIRDMSEQKILKEKLIRISDIQSVLYDILSLTLQKLSLKEILEKILNKLLSISWLSLEAKGSIFLVDENPQELVLKVSTNLSTQLLSICKIVPFGKCLCGRAALNRKIVYSQHLDETHENSYDGIIPHGHYCVPLINNDTVIGVINVYLKDNHVRINEDEDFLKVFASLVTKIILHYKSEEKILKLNSELENKVEKRTQQLVDTNKTLTQEIEVRRKTENLLMESNERYDILIKTSLDGFWIANTEGFILEVNDEYCAMIGYSREQLLKMHISNVEAKETEEITREHINLVITKGYDRFETLHRCADGKSIDVEISAVYISSQKIILVFVNDISQRKHYESILKHANKKLAELNLTKDKFFSIIAHDLKNPFAGLLSSCELLKRNIRKQDLSKIEKHTESIYESSRKAHNILEDLLNWARLQMGNCEVKKEKFNIHYLICDVLSGLQNISETKEIEIIVSGTEKAVAFFDKEMFKMLLRNFTTNAIKFSNKGQKVIIEITDMNEQQFLVSIKDSGIGIKEEDLEKLFRIDISHSTSGTADEKGTGLGLILCKEFAEKNNSEIFVESKKNIGSTFGFTVEKVLD